LEEELAKRGVPEPDPDLLERMTRMLVAGEGPLGQLGVAREMWNLLAEARAVLTEDKEVPKWLKPPPGHEVGVPTKPNPDGAGVTSEAADIDLVEGIQPFLARAFEASYVPEWDDDEESQCKVWIDTRRTPASGTPLQVMLGQEMIGTLASEDTQTLERDLRKAKRRKQPLILDATIEREHDQFSVWVIVPPD
jgi:hypothetical protein